MPQKSSTVLSDLDCKTVGFFRKISKEIGKARRKSFTRAELASLTRPRKKNPLSLSVFSLVSDLLFDCSRVLEQAKIRTVSQSLFYKLAVPQLRTEFYKRSLSYTGSVLWNSLPLEVRQLTSPSMFKGKLRDINFD